MLKFAIVLFTPGSTNKREFQHLAPCSDRAQLLVDLFPPSSTQSLAPMTQSKLYIIVYIARWTSVISEEVWDMGSG